MLLFRYSCCQWALFSSDNLNLQRAIILQTTCGTWRQEWHSFDSIIMLHSDSLILFQSYQHQESAMSNSSIYEPKRKHRRSREDSTGPGYHTSTFDLTHSLTKTDYFSDINPRSVRRLLNIAAVTGKTNRKLNQIYLQVKFLLHCIHVQGKFCSGLFSPFVPSDSRVNLKQGEYNIHKGLLSQIG